MESPLKYLTCWTLNAWEPTGFFPNSGNKNNLRGKHERH